MSLRRADRPRTALTVAREVARKALDEGNNGQLVKACDLLAAFLEADESLRNGVASGYLTQARLRLAATLQDRTRFPSCLQLDSLLADFD